MNVQPQQRVISELGQRQRHRSQRPRPRIPQSIVDQDMAAQD
jgi:hypothetical protein